MENMDKIKNIVLIGPSGVGKTFISNELSNKTKLPVFCIDDIILMLQEQLYGNLSAEESNMRRYKLMNLMESGYNNLSHAEQQKQEAMVDEFLEKFKMYFSKLQGFGFLFEDIVAYNKICSQNKNPSVEFIIAQTQALHLKITQKILNILNEPCIIDTPAPLGIKPKYKTENGNICPEAGNTQNALPLSQLEKLFESTLENSGTIVYLEPGIDYTKRIKPNNPFNAWIAENLDNYYDGAHICVSVNGMFNSPENPSLKSRKLFDITSNETANKIKNKAEIASICDLIINAQNALIGQKEPNL